MYGYDYDDDDYKLVYATYSPSIHYAIMKACTSCARCQCRVVYVHEA